MTTKETARRGRGGPKNERKTRASTTQIITQTAAKIKSFLTARLNKYIRVGGA